MPESPTTNYQPRTTNALSGRPSVLIVSNGYGEDAVGNGLAQELREKAKVVAYPLVGLGSAYQDVPLLDPRRDLPSGGFGLRGSWPVFLDDLRAGAWGLWRKQREALRRQRDKHTRIVALGDAYCLWIAAHAGKPAAFVATAKSEYNEPYRWFERALIRRLASVVYTRDEITAKTLNKHGIPARFSGNPLMDTVQAEADLPRNRSWPTVTLLPGSRREAAKNLVLLLQLSDELALSTDTNIFCAVANTIHKEELMAEARRVGWQDADSELSSKHARVVLTNAFGSAIRSADVVVGLAGTANEQAAGLGKPVVAFPGSGAQYSKNFMRLQHRLLGDALVPARNWKEAAAAVIRLLRSPGERARRGQVGRDRMGEPGAIQRIAGELI